MAKISKKIILTYNYKNETLDLDTDGGVQLDLGVNILLAGITSLANMAIQAAPPSHQQMMKENVYDSLNLAFAKILEAIIPTDDIPDFTTESIIETQNKMIEDAARQGLSIDEYLNNLRAARSTQS